MSAPIIESDAKIKASLPPGMLKPITSVTVPSNDTWFKDASGFLYQQQHVAKGIYPIYDWSFDPQTPVVGTSLTSGTQIRFDFNFSPFYHAVDNDAFYLEINVSNTATTAGDTVTPTFAELFFDDQKGIEWQMNGTSFEHYPAMQVLLEPALELPNSQYTNMASLANHDETLAYNSAAKSAIAASGTAQYWVRVPNPFPDEGFWFGALGNNTLTLAVNTNVNGCVDSAASGVLNLVSMRLHVQSLVVPPESYGQLQAIWGKRRWRGTGVVQNYPQQYALVASGDSPKIKLDQLRDETCVFALSLIRASRAIAGTALLNTIHLPGTSTVRIESKDGTIIFSSAAQPYQYLRLLQSLRHFGSSNAIENLYAVPHFIDPSAMTAIHREDSNGSYVFTGDEYLYISNSGSTSSVYIDTFAWCQRTYSIDGGFIARPLKY